MVPIAFEDPVPFFELPGLGGDPGGEFLAAGHVPQLNAGQGHPALEEMGVTVDEPGEDQGLAQVHDPGLPADELLDIARFADARDPVAVDRQGLGPGIGRIDGPDGTVQEDQISHFRLGSRAARSHYSQRQDQASGFENIHSSFLL